MTTIDPALLDEAVELARGIGRVTLEWFRSPALEVERKGDGTPVTEADRSAERFARDELARRHPADRVIGEEEPDTAGASGRTWIVDPIDGTKAFTRGVPLYSNLLALHDEHGPAIGVVNLPALGQTVYAGRGLGCFADGVPVRVNQTPTLDHGCVCTSGLGPWRAEPLAALRSSGALLRTWGDGYGFTLVATGRVEAMVDPLVAIWDIAPMPVIISEAGGRFTDLDGRDTTDLDPASSYAGVATNGLVHDEVLALFGSAASS